MSYSSSTTNIFVTCPSNIEPLLAEELKKLGIASEPGHRGLFVEKTMRHVYLINYLSRLATRVLWPLHTFRCRDKVDLYNQSLKINWDEYLTVESTFAIDSNVSHPQLKNSLFAAQILKDAICDQMRKRHGQRPSVDVQRPDTQLNLFIYRGQATVSLDTSLLPLYRRGYRDDESGPAPLQESLAAAILLKAGYTAEDVLFDPCCGSGTFLMEAAMIATNTPAGFFRKVWGFTQMPEFEIEEWLQIKKEANAKRSLLPTKKLFGNDHNPLIVQQLKKSLASLNLPVEITLADVTKIEAPKEATMLVCNPPYGKRIAVDNSLYAALGSIVKNHDTMRACLICPEDALIKATHLPFRRAQSLSNGGIPIGVYLYK